MNTTQDSWTPAVGDVVSFDVHAIGGRVDHVSGPITAVRYTRAGRPLLTVQTERHGAVCPPVDRVTLETPAPVVLCGASGCDASAPFPTTGKPARCTLDHGHRGPHAAHGVSGAVLHSWPRNLATITTAVGRFDPDGPRGYVARSGGPVRATREEAATDELSRGWFALAEHDAAACSDACRYCAAMGVPWGDDVQEVQR